MFTASRDGVGPFVIRYPRGRGVLTDWRCPLESVEVGTGRLLREGSDIAVLSLGPVGNTVEKALQEMADEGIHVAHYDMRFLKPIDEAILNHVGRSFRCIVTVEDGTVRGGLGSAVLEYMADHDMHPTVRRLGLPDRFVEHGTPDELYHIVGIDKDGIQNTINALLAHGKPET